MKLRAITLAAAGLLAAASAQAELQTWRFSGLLMGHWDYLDGRGNATVPPEQMQFDLTFDTAAVANGNTFTNALVNVVIDGQGYSLYKPSLVVGTPRTELTAFVENFILEGSYLSMSINDSSAITSVSEFLATTDQRIEDIYQNFVVNDGYTWGELVAAPWMEYGFPQIWLSKPYVSGQGYALIGAHNITPGVPEPSSWALALLGGVGAAAVARRRQPARQAEAQAA